MSQTDSSDDEADFEGQDEEIEEELAFAPGEAQKYADWFDDEELSDDAAADDEVGDDAWSDEEGDGEASDSAEEAQQAENEEGTLYEALGDGYDDGDVAAGTKGSRGAKRDLELADEWLAGSGSDAESSGLTEGEESDDESGEANRAGLPNSHSEAGAQNESRAAAAGAITEAIQEGAFNVGAIQGAQGAALSISDLLQGVSTSRAERKRLNKLAEGTQTLAAPLPRDIRDRQTRKAAYEDSKKHMSRWVPLVKANREAPTVRLTQKVELPAVRSTAGLASKLEPQSELEKEVAALLQVAGHHSAAGAVNAEDDLAASQMTADELERRRAAMAKTNALLFYHDMKAKRIKKIKSKSYHRRLKKQRARLEEAMAGVQAEDKDAQQAKAELAEFERAKERLTLKHRNTSRWARRVLKRGLQLAPDEQREALQEQLRHGRELRAKPAALHQASSSASESDSDEPDEGADPDGKPKAAPRLTTKEKAELADAIARGEGNDLEDLIPKKGLFAMPFMQRALRQQAHETAEAARDLLDETERPDSEPGHEEEAGRKAERDTDATPGRLSFGPGFGSKRSKPASSGPGFTGNEGDDYWLSGDEDEDAEARGQRQQAVDENDKQVEVAENELQGKQKGDPSHGPGPEAVRRMRRSELAQLASRVGVGGRSGPTAVTMPQQEPQQPAEQGDQAPRDSNNGAVSASGSRTQAKKPQVGDDTRQNATGTAGDVQGQGAATTGDELEGVDGGRPPDGIVQAAMAAAFAGDDVMDEFEKDKAAAAEESTAAVEEPVSLPGWGRWASVKKEPKWLVEKRAAAAKEKARRLATRADAKLPGVFISEKWDKKFQRYTTPAVPFPFKNKEVYEKSMRVPLARECNTQTSFRDLTRPAVLKRTGEIIQPLQFSKAAVEASKLSRQKGTVIVCEGGTMKRRKHG